MEDLAPGTTLGQYQIEGLIGLGGMASVYRGQHLALEIDAKFRLQDMGAVQFQLASAILEEAGGLQQEEVVSELLSLGLAAVLEGAAKAAETMPTIGSQETVVDEGKAAPFLGRRATEWPGARVVH
jgi:hypothetical protein